MSLTPRPVKSPCIHICALDEHDICTGCQRSASEITRWTKMDDQERRDVLKACYARAKAAGILLG